MLIETPLLVTSNSQSINPFWVKRRARTETRNSLFNGIIFLVYHAESIVSSDQPPNLSEISDVVNTIRTKRTRASWPKSSGFDRFHDVSDGFSHVSGFTFGQIARINATGTEHLVRYVKSLRSCQHVNVGHIEVRS